mgnify:CR=1 FL=1
MAEVDVPSKEKIKEIFTKVVGPILSKEHREKVQSCANSFHTMAIDFTDIGLKLCFRVSEEGNAEFTEGIPEKVDLTLTWKSDVWHNIAMKTLSPITAASTGQLAVGGGPMATFVGMLPLLDPMTEIYKKELGVE